MMKFGYNDLKESQHVKVILYIPTDINESEESRVVVAKEIKVLTD